MFITAVTIHDFKRLKSVEIIPRSDVSLILIGGKNAQGKTSILDALTAALGGAATLPADPVRHGAKEAEITIEFDGGKLVVTRIIRVGGRTSLQVSNPDGILKSQQGFLDKLIGARFLDPLAFLQLPVKAQRALLMRLIDGAERIDGLNERREKAFGRRTEIHRDLEKAKGELARLKADALPIGEPIDVAALDQEKTKLAEVARANYDLVVAEKQALKDLGVAEERLAAKKAAIARVQLELKDLVAGEELDVETVRLLKGKATAANAKVSAAVVEWDKVAPRREEIDAEIARAADHNRAVYAAEANAKRMFDAQTAAELLDKQHGELTGVLTEIDKRKAAILEAAKLPVPGLAVTDEGVELAGVPFDQASGAEKHRVAVALAIAASPNLNDIWVRDGALLDDDSLAAIAKQAGDAGKRLWIERVGTADPGVIVISDGEVVGS